MATKAERSSTRQHRRDVVVDETLEHSEHLSDGFLEALGARRDARDLGGDRRLEQLAVEQVADAGQDVVGVEFERIGPQRRPATTRGFGCGDRAAHSSNQVRCLEILGQVAVGAGLGAPIPVARRVKRRQKDDRDLGGLPVVFEQPGCHITRNTRHLDVEDDRVGMALEHRLNSLDAILSGDDLETLAREHAGHDASQGRAVVGDHHGGHVFPPRSERHCLSDVNVFVASRCLSADEAPNRIYELGLVEITLEQVGARAGLETGPAVALVAARGHDHDRDLLPASGAADRPRQA